MNVAHGCWFWCEYATTTQIVPNFLFFLTLSESSWLLTFPTSSVWGFYLKYPLRIQVDQKSPQRSAARRNCSYVECLSPKETTWFASSIRSSPHHRIHPVVITWRRPIFHGVQIKINSANSGKGWLSVHIRLFGDIFQKIACRPFEERLVCNN